jgi:outer membrane cobalamin receptor
MCCVSLFCILSLVPLVGWAQTPAEEAADAVDVPQAASTADEQGASPAQEAVSEKQLADVAEPEIEVEVTATHEWPAKVETVTAEQVESMVNAPFIGDVLERLPGADTLFGCPMGAPLITVRGNNSEWTEILLEGIPISPIGRPYILNYLPMAAIDTVRLLKGPVPPKYPGTTIAGLVLLDMKTGDRYPGVETTATIGGYGQRILDVNAGGGNAERNYFLSFSHNQMSGWLPHSDMDMDHLATKLVVTPNTRSKLTLVGDYLFGEKNGPRPLGPNPADKWAAEWTDVEQPKASLTYERTLSDRSDMLLRVTPYWFSGTQLWQQWFTDHVEPRFMPWDYELLRTEFQHNIRVQPERIVSWGASWQRDTYAFAGPLKVSFWDSIPGDKWKEYTKRARSVYAQYSQPTGGEGVLTLGGRYDADEPGDSIASPFFSWLHPLAQDTKLRLALTRNRRFPRLMELYGEGMWTGNPALQPELGWTYQADLSRAFRSGSLDLSVYQSDLEGLIAADENNVFSNIGEARLRGAELSWQGQWRRGCYWANYTLLDAENRDTGGPLIVAFRTAFPKHSAKAGVSIRDARGGEHSLEVLAYGPRRTNVDTPTYVGEPWNVTVPPRLPGFTWVNYKYSWPLKDSGKFTLAVENVFDANVQDLLFYPRPGRWVSGAISWHF